MTPVVCGTLDDLLRWLIEAKKSGEVTPFQDTTGEHIGFESPIGVYLVRRSVLVQIKSQRIFLNHDTWDKFVTVFPDKVIL